MPVAMSHGPVLESGQSALHGVIETIYKDKYYRVNLMWFIPGAFAGLAATFVGLDLHVIRRNRICHFRDDVRIRLSAAPIGVV